jgi:adenosine deaminase
LGAIKDFIQAMPKAELHLHLEGSLEPEMMMALAGRNGTALAYGSVEALRAAYDFTELQDFLDIYYQGMSVLQTSADFFDLTWAYLEKVHGENVDHVEVFFDPQTHTDRGVPFGAVVDGIGAALSRGSEELGITSQLILCFLRHQSEAAAFETLESAEPYRDRIAAVGLDSSEVGNPPSRFQRVFQRARDRGYRCVAHAGEEGPPEYIREALDILAVERIDHGIRCVEAPDLVERLARERVPLTVCPLSNVRLGIFDRIEDHCLPQLLKHGLCVTVNSDDPAFFGAYLTENLRVVAEAFELDADALRQLSHNALEASFASDSRKQELREAIDSCHA